ncbi:MAG: response regulator [Deltaproteobacteria bacterium]|nr:response regulator [Deltaproteobacteria bacterium]
MEPERQTVLIVDDSPANIEILSKLLGVEHEILFSTNGGKALEIAFDQDPNLILLDVLMPEMDGYEVCRCLKQNPASKDIPIIFITALDQEEDEARGLELGAVDYITKPFNPAIVKLRVANQLELQWQRQTLALRNGELKEALSKIKTLSGLLPICSSCKKIRDDQGYWNQLETYIHEHSEAEFTHGLCPECIKEFFPEVYEKRYGQEKRI